MLIYLESQNLISHFQIWKYYMSCYNCQHEFEENEGRYCHSDGMLCNTCEKNIKEIKLESNKTLFEKDVKISFLENQELGKYTINGELLSKYASTINHLKFFTTIAIGKPDMFIVDNIISKKELILRDLFVNANVSYDSMGIDSDAREFLELLHEWTEDTIKCTVN